MNQIASLRRLAFITLGISLLACSGQLLPPGNEELAIAEFKIVADTAQHTTIAAFDADQQQIGSVDLVHGTIVLGADYEADAGKQAQGRELNVTIRGETFQWQTLGFTDTSHMPTLPDFKASVAALLADPHVQPMLERWEIGWRSAAGPAATGEVAQYADFCDVNQRGDTTNTCSGTTCPITSGNTPVCQTSSLVAGADAHQYASDFGYGYDQYLVDACCSNNNYTQKTCADDNSDPNHHVSDCGDGGTNRCIACFSPISVSSCNVYASVEYGYDLLCRNLSGYGQCLCETGTWTYDYEDSSWSCAYDESNFGYMSSDQCTSQETGSTDCEDYGYVVYGCGLI